MTKGKVEILKWTARYKYSLAPAGYCLERMAVFPTTELRTFNRLIKPEHTGRAKLAA